MATNRFFNNDNLAISDGQLAKAVQLNSLTDETNAAFELVASEIDTIAQLGTTAFKWANNDQGELIDPINNPNDYSSKANAQEAEAWASGVGGVDTKADGVTTITRSSKEYSEDTEADAISTAADAASTAADVISTNADVVSTNADVVSTNADVVSTGLDVIAADLSASNALASEVKAQEWAEEVEDVEVEPGKFSALHWAAKSEESSSNSVLFTSSTGQAIIPAGTTLEQDAPSAGHFRFNTDEAKFEGHDGVEWGEIGGGGLDWSEAIKTSSFTAESGLGYVIDTTGGEVTLTLPLTPEDGFIVGIVDHVGNFATLNCIVDQNGETIMALDETLILDQDNGAIVLVFNGGDWRIAEATPYAEATVSYPRKNLLINPSFEVAQDSVADGGSMSSSDYLADMWVSLFTTGAISAVRETGVIGVEVDTSPTLTGSVYLSPIRYYGESSDIKGLFEGGTVTLSFKIYASVTGTFTSALRLNQNVPEDRRTYYSEFTVDTADTWVDVEITIDIPAGYAELIDDNGRGFTIAIGNISGPDGYQSSDTWIATGTSVGQTSGTVNWAATAGNVLKIKEVKLEEGDSATPFVQPNISEELAKCQRYYQVITPGGTGYRAAYTAQTGMLGFSSTLSTVMRASPTSARTTGTYYNCSNGTVTASATSVTCLVSATASGPYRNYGYTVYLNARID